MLDHAGAGRRRAGRGRARDNIGAGIRWAVDHGARIVNVSLASNGFDIDELGAIEYAHDHGVLVVAAAGNGGNTEPLYPGGLSGRPLGGRHRRERPARTAGRPAARGSQLAAPGCAEVLDPNAGPAYGCGSSFGRRPCPGIAGLLLSLARA